jgi:hypothetical protein
MMFRELLEVIKDAIIERKSKELDTVIVVFGAEGTGKSMFGLKLGEYLLEDNVLEFNVFNNVVYHSVEFIKIFNKGNQYILVDEALNLFYSKEHMGNSYIAKQLFRGRFKLNTLAIVVQNLRWLDPVVREHRARLFIMTDKTAHGYRLLVFGSDKAKELYYLQRELGYSRIEKYYKLASHIIEDPEMPSKKTIEKYKLLKEANNILGSLLDLVGLSEAKFAKAYIIGGKDEKKETFMSLLFKLLEGDEDKRKRILNMIGIDYSKNKEYYDRVIEILREKYLNTKKILRGEKRISP